MHVDSGAAAAAPNSLMTFGAEHDTETETVSASGALGLTIVEEGEAGRLPKRLPRSGYARVAAADAPTPGAAERRAVRAGSSLAAAALVTAAVVTWTALGRRAGLLKLDPGAAPPETKEGSFANGCGVTEVDVEYLFEEPLGSDLGLASVQDCCSQCLAHERCQGWVWAGNLTGSGACLLGGGSQLGKRPAAGSVTGLVRRMRAVSDGPAALNLVELDSSQLPPSGPSAMGFLADVKTAVTAMMHPQLPALPRLSLPQPQLPQLQFPGFATSPSKEVDQPDPARALETVTVLPQDFGGRCQMVDLPTVPEYDVSGYRLEVKLLTYNLFWWNLMDRRHGNGGAPFELIRESGKPRPYDFMAFQECNVAEVVLEGADLSAEYFMFGGLDTKTTAICMAFRKTTWQLLDRGASYVAEDSKRQYYGKRAVQWMRLQHMTTGRTAFFMNHHGPLPINSGGKCGGVTTARRILTVIQEHAQQGDAVILAGDFNAGPLSPTIRQLTARLDKAYSGNAEGGIDNIFSNLGAGSVLSALNLGGAGSDHDALAVVLELGGKDLPAPARSPLMRFFDWLFSR